ncbi:MAG: methionyl-tRNA formyltransferase [Faecalibacterium sp.]
MRILFMGTPDIAATCLEALYAAGHEICGVYTRRDKPVGRKQVLTAPPVKTVALAHSTPVFQPRTLRDGSEDANIQSLAPDIIVVVAYGCILPKQILEMPQYGCINLHVSLLPKYRGSAPIQWAVLNGDAETGVSIMQMDEGLDTGDVLLCKTLAIDPNETSGQLFDRVTAIGAAALCEVLPAMVAGQLTAVPQPTEGASHAPMLSKEMAAFSFAEDAAHIHNWVRGMNPWPGAWVMVDDKKLKVTESRLLTNADIADVCAKVCAQLTKSDDAISDGAMTADCLLAGTVLATKPLTVLCKDGAIVLSKVVPEGSKQMDGNAFAAGKRLKIGDIL